MAEGKWISGLTAETPLAEAARRVLTVRLEVVRDYLALALREPDKDPEHVHQLRVGTRRAGAALEIFAPCLPDKVYTEMRKHLRRLRRAAGRARDWDVFLLALAAENGKKKPRHGPGLDFLRGYALGQRENAQASLSEACPDFPFDFDQLLSETVAAVHRPHYDHGSRTLLDLAGPLLFGLMHDLEQAGKSDLNDYAHLHRVRILGKRLRYAMEIFVDCFDPAFRTRTYAAVEEMQEILGRANDSHVAIQRLSALCEKVQTTLPADWKRLRPGIEGLLKYHEERLPQERERFLEWWERWLKSEGIAALGMLTEAMEPAGS